MSTPLERGALFEVDESELPILRVRYPVRGTVEMFEDLFEVYRRVAREQPRVAYLIDMTYFDALGANAAMRRAAAELAKRHGPELAHSAVCEARVVSSPMVKGVLVAFDWLKGDPLWPCRTFTSMSEARDWVREQLEADARA